MVKSRLKAWLKSGIVLVALSYCFTGYSDELTVSGRLKKMSRIIKGLDPAPEDYVQLKAAFNKGQEEEFFKTKAGEYTASPDHLRKMVVRLGELFRIRINVNNIREDNLRDSSNNKGSKVILDFDTALEKLFKSIVSDNLTWDKLLSSKVYQIQKAYDRQELYYSSGENKYPTISDNRFFQGIFSNLNDKAKTQTVTGNSDDPRLAGSITTGKFASRYANTIANKNRRRAAAVFRIFLCDDMRPAVQTDVGELEALIHLALEEDSQNAKPGNDTETEKTAAQRHADDPKCLACHYKLDPMAQTFFAMGSVLSTEPTPGSLVFRRKDGSLVQIPARGIGDIANAILKQPEYSQCQVHRFWDWFMPIDAELTDERLEELTSEFNKLNHKPNSFIAKLVNLPEFYGKPAASDTGSAINGNLYVSHVKPVLKKCTSCHMTMGFPSLVRFPIGGTAPSHLKWLTEVTKKLDLANDGRNRIMPPTQAGWDLTFDQIKWIKEWISKDAPDETDRRTLELGQGLKMLEGK